MDGPATDWGWGSILHFINPMGETLVYFQSGFNELLLSFGVCSVAGVIFGSLCTQLFQDLFTWNGFLRKRLLESSDWSNSDGNRRSIGNGMYHRTGCYRKFHPVHRFIHRLFSILLGSAVTMKTRYFLIYYEVEANLLTSIFSALADIRLVPKSFRRLDPI